MQIYIFYDWDEFDVPQMDTVKVTGKRYCTITTDKIYKIAHEKNHALFLDRETLTSQSGFVAVQID